MYCSEKYDSISENKNLTASPVFKLETFEILFIKLKLELGKHTQMTTNISFITSLY